ncbi:hypothetical protein Misp01_26590 [Microtetraspora sp. NBRC 13810]|uniref:hypothetical protein n=1 Tax=Microtetraspora sp. NBRC 13810 TaxID=3030990 RepID=UPI0024A5F074|nr:hypothetical protein [Microtetraspora sp. NBRC 13810]GLW07529.1 hypothetical protein Misp01_26590 [Microtetraspora sp. NBRC 13810]
MICGAVARVLGPPAETFAADAKPVEGCFGLVEGASEQLGSHYETFYTEVRDFAADLHQKLGSVGAAFMEVSRAMSESEAHNESEMARLNGGD